MDQRLADLLQLLELERLELNLFRGASRDIGSPQVFGGQVLGQALSAAWKEAAMLKICCPCWMATTRRLEKLWPSRLRSTSYTIGAL